MCDQTPLYSTRQVADRLGLHDGHIRRLAAQLGIGTLIGKQWVFTDADIDALRARNTRPGRKPNPDRTKPAP